MTIRVGVGGWTYEPWRGVFYPEGLAQKRELEYAARALTAIEINATYYGRQKPQSWRNWAASTPDGFVFSLKASRYCTQRKCWPRAATPWKMFLEQGFMELGDKLGPINWQLADGKKFDREDFARFLDLIPDQQDGVTLRHALEVRDASFCDPAFLDLARARNMAVVFADDDEFPCIARPNRRLHLCPAPAQRRRRSRRDMTRQRSTGGPSRPGPGPRAVATFLSISSRAQKSAIPPPREALIARLA